MDAVRELRELVEFRSETCGRHQYDEMTTQNADGVIVYAARVEFSSPLVRSYDSVTYHATFEEAKQDAALVALVALRRRFHIAASAAPIKPLNDNRKST